MFVVSMILPKSFSIVSGEILLCKDDKQLMLGLQRRSAAISNSWKCDMEIRSSSFMGIDVLTTYELHSRNFTECVLYILTQLLALFAN